jgi:hypothetical protein
MADGNGDREFTLERKERFLRALEVAGGSIGEACRQIGISWQTYRRHREEDPQFDHYCARAIGYGVEVLEDEAIRRALRGVQEPIYYRGQMIDAVQKYSDQLLMFLLRARKPLVYREHKAVELEMGTETRKVLVHRYGAPETP